MRHKRTVINPPHLLPYSPKKHRLELHDCDVLIDDVKTEWYSNMQPIIPHIETLSKSVVALNTETLTPKQAKFLRKINRAIPPLVDCWWMARTAPQFEARLSYQLIDAITTVTAYIHILDREMVGKLDDIQAAHVRSMQAAIDAIHAEVNALGHHHMPVIIKSVG